MRRAELLALLFALAVPVADAQDTTMAHAKHMTWGRTSYLLADVLEYRNGDEALGVDLVGWVGGASRRMWFKTDGALLDGRTELQALYGRMVAPFWDVQLGAWAATDLGRNGEPTRGGVALGVQGLAPGWFDVEAALLLSTEAHLSSRITASSDLYLTQRFILQSRLEAAWAARPDRDVLVGAGLGETELALRLRYEIRREFAPYVGVVWERAFGETARLSSGNRRPQIALGVRLWY